MTKKYLMVSFEDPKMKKLSEVLGNNTCKKVIDYLAEKESSKTDISKALKIPLNTTEYNVNKLIESGLIEKSKNYFWSKKGKKIAVYKISNKSIVISPKSSNKIKNIGIIAVVSGLAAGLIKLIGEQDNQTPLYAAKELIDNSSFGECAAQMALTASQPVINTIASQPWFWFLIGALGIGVLILILNWKKL